MSVSGLKRTSSAGLAMSVNWGRPEVAARTPNRCDLPKLVINTCAAGYDTTALREPLPHICAADFKNVIRRCEPLHIDPAGSASFLIEGTSSGREKCVTSSFSSRHPPPSSQLAQAWSQLASIGIAYRAMSMLARAIVDLSVTSNVRLPHRAAWLTALPIQVSQPFK